MRYLLLLTALIVAGCDSTVDPGTILQEDTLTYRITLNQTASFRGVSYIPEFDKDRVNDFVDPTESPFTWEVSVPWFDGFKGFIAVQEGDATFEILRNGEVIESTYFPPAPGQKFMGGIVTGEDLYMTSQLITEADGEPAGGTTFQATANDIPLEFSTWDSPEGTKLQRHVTVSSG